MNKTRLDDYCEMCEDYERMVEYLNDEIDNLNFQDFYTLTKEVHELFNMIKEEHKQLKKDGIL